MRKWLIRGSAIVITTWGISYTPLVCDKELLPVIYTVLGIMFSIALSQLISFSFSEIDNEQFVKKQRKQVRDIRTSFIVQFSLATVFFISYSYGAQFSIGWFRFDWRILVFVYLLYCLAYFIVNFIALAHLKDKIEDDVRKIRNKPDQKYPE